MRESETSEDPAPKVRSRGRRAAYWAIFVVVLLVPVELASLAMLRVVDGRGFSPQRYAAERLAVSESRAVPTRGNDETVAVPRSVESQVVHPFLGFVFDADRKTPMWGREVGPVPNELGFLEMNDRPRKAPKRSDFTVGIFGGSVAMLLSLFEEEDIIQGLEASPALAGRRVRVESCAIAGYKQPQQLATLTYLLALGKRFDVVVNLDGFNELALPVVENVPRRTYPLYPRLWDIRVSGVSDLGALERIGELAYARSRRRQVAKSFVPAALAWSPTWNLIWRLRDRALAARIGELEAAVAATEAGNDSYQSRGPQWRGGRGAKLLEALSDDWSRCSLLMHRLATANGIRYYHLLQPNQYLPGSKPLSSEELELAFDPKSPYKPVIEKGYAGLQRRGRELAESGVRFLDLSGIFRDETETLYTDTCCHFGKRGNQIVAERLVAAIREDLERSAESSGSATAAGGL